jgi:hypothetical protein
MLPRPRSAAILLTLAAALTLHGDTTPQRHLPPALAGSPPVILWAWEEPEDLRTLDPAQTGLAFLADRIFLTDTLHHIPRRQRILVPRNVWAEAVVRIEPLPGFTDSEALRQATAQQILQSAALPNLRALQIDFDATQSQRPFYADILRRTRAGLPPHTALTITALLSWCSVQDGWLRNLPIDQAIPMYFRLGQHRGRWPIREPLCTGSLGISTDEPETAPTLTTTRLYLFAPRPWTPTQLTQINAAQIPTSPKGNL